MKAAGNDLDKAKAAAAECLDAYDQFGAKLGAIRWGQVQPQMDDVIKGLGTLQVLLSDMANASDVASFVAAENQVTAAAGTLHGAVNVLRSALGLPPSSD